jgi:protein-arginine kinase activator protein McsA
MNKMEREIRKIAEKLSYTMSDCPMTKATRYEFIDQAVASILAVVEKENAEHIEKAAHFEMELFSIKRQNAKYREALEAIIKHEVVVGGSMSECSSTYRIAKRALTIGEEGEK